MTLRFKNRAAVLLAMALTAGFLNLTGAAASEPDFSLKDHEPMVFTLGRFASSPDCGPPCADFIIASGEITSFGYFKLLLAHVRAGSRSLPLILHSPGGNISVATALGDIMGKLEMRVIVARAVPVRCVGKQPCKNTEVRPYFLKANKAGCASACALAIAGAPRRVLPEGAFIGVHRPHVDEEETPFSKDDGIIQLAEDIAINVMGNYYARHGITPEIMDFVKSANPDGMRWLTRDELLRTGLIVDSDQSLPRPNPRPQKSR